MVKIEIGNAFKLNNNKYMFLVKDFGNGYVVLSLYKQVKANGFINRLKQLVNGNRFITWELVRQWETEPKTSQTIANQWVSLYSL